MKVPQQSFASYKQQLAATAGITVGDITLALHPESVRSIDPRTPRTSALATGCFRRFGKQITKGAIAIAQQHRYTPQQLNEFLAAERNFILRIAGIAEQVQRSGQRLVLMSDLDETHMMFPLGKPRDDVQVLRPACLPLLHTLTDAMPDTRIGIVTLRRGRTHEAFLALPPVQPIVPFLDRELLVTARYAGNINHGWLEFCASYLLDPATTPLLSPFASPDGVNAFRAKLDHHIQRHIAQNAEYATARLAEFPNVTRWDYTPEQRAWWSAVVKHQELQENSYIDSKFDIRSRRVAHSDDYFAFSSALWGNHRLKDSDEEQVVTDAPGPHLLSWAKLLRDRLSIPSIFPPYHWSTQLGLGEMAALFAVPGLLAPIVNAAERLLASIQHQETRIKTAAHLFSAALIAKRDPNAVVIGIDDIGGELPALLATGQAHTPQFINGGLWDLFGLAGAPRLFICSNHVPTFTPVPTARR